MSNKRGSEDISVEAQLSPQSEGSTPKRSKLDFLALVAELSEQKNDASKISPLAVAAAAALPIQSVEQPIKSESPPPLMNSASPKQTDGPKSSFAAWKLAKGRKNSSNPSKTDNTAEAGKKSPSLAASMENPLVAMAAAASLLPVATTMPSSEVEPTGSVPSKQASKNRDSSSTKKITSTKKTGGSLKKDKGAVSPKKKSKGKSKKGDQSGGKSPTFPEKVMELLQTGPTMRAIYWLPEGEAIAVDPEKFKDNPIISKQFRGNKLSSFVRSLNRWGFRRIFYHSLPDKTLAFYHRLFQKNQPALIKDMKMDAGEQELDLPPGAMATAPISSLDGSVPVVPPSVVEELPKKAESAVSALGGGDAPPEVASAVAANPPLPVLPEKAPPSPPIAAPAPAGLEIVQAAMQAAGLPVQAPAPPVLPVEPVASAVIPAAVPSSHNALERTALELAESQHALQLQQAMAAEQERSDLALQSLQAQQLVLQSLVDQQNVAQAEELLMQSMIAEQQRSELALQQRQAEQALLQQMVAEQETAALTAALGGAAGSSVGLSAEALIRERLLLQQLAATPAPAPASGGSDVLALLQQQLQGGQQQPQAHSEPSYLEQLVLLEQQQQQQQQRQQEAALLAAHGFRFG